MPEHRHRASEVRPHDEFGMAPPIDPAAGALQAFGPPMSGLVGAGALNGLSSA
jgi:hypothetical protein